MFVARYTFDPHYDARRRWTAYIGYRAETREALARQIVDLRATRLPQRIACALDAGDPEGEEQAIAYVLEHEDMRYHEVLRVWMLVHHPNGLSCWPLAAETLEEAIAEARDADASGAIAWHGWGHVTIGNVRFAATIRDDLHIFETDDTMMEI